MISRRLVRNFMSSAIRRSDDHGPSGVPGSNLPISINNRYKLTAGFILFFGSGLGIPYLIVRHQVLKNK